MTDEMEKYVKEFEELLDLVHASTTVEAIELTNDQKMQLFAIFRKDKRTPQGGYNKPWSGGGGGFKSDMKPIKMDGLNQGSYDYVIDYLTDAGFVKKTVTTKTGSEFDVYEAKSLKGDKIGFQYSDKKRDWYAKFYDKELRSYEYLNKNYSEEMEKLLIVIGVINNREVQNAVLKKVADEPVKTQEQPLEEME